MTRRCGLNQLQFNRTAGQKSGPHLLAFHRFGLVAGGSQQLFKNRDGLLQAVYRDANMFQFHDSFFKIVNSRDDSCTLPKLPKLPIYLDFLSTTPCDERVVEAMLPFFSKDFGNAASHTHAHGWYGAEAVKQAREQIAELIGSEPGEIVFTSGATESDNLAIKGIFSRFAARGNHILTCSTEHRAVLDTCAHLERMGGEVTYLPVDSAGRISIADLEQELRPSTVLVCIMYANNETGVIQPLEEIGRICRARHILLMSDATQAVGKIPVDLNRDRIDLMAFSAHKIYGPKGIGALYLRRKGPRADPEPQMDGGGHEGGFRSGTLNVPGIVGFGKACQICREFMEEDRAHTLGLRDFFESGLTGTALARINGSPTHRLPQASNLEFQGIEGSRLLSRLTADLSASLGSACTSARPEPSHVLKAMGRSDSQVRSCLRFSFGRTTTREEVDFALDRILSAIRDLRA